MVISKNEEERMSTFQFKIITWKWIILGIIAMTRIIEFNLAKREWVHSWNIN